VLFPLRMNGTLVLPGFDEEAMPTALRPCVSIWPDADVGILALPYNGLEGLRFTHRLVS